MSRPGYLSCAGCGRLFKERNPVEVRFYQQHSCGDGTGWPNVNEQAVLIWQVRDVQQAFVLLASGPLNVDEIAKEVPIQQARQFREWWNEMKRKHTMVDL